MNETTPTTRAEIIARLILLPDEIRTAENLLHRLRWDVRQAENELELAEARLVLDPEGPINGKNAEVRAAQVLLATQAECDAVNEAQDGARGAEIDLRLLQNEFAALRAVSRILAGGPDL